jgi:hypothetical protein
MIISYKDIYYQVIVEQGAMRSSWEVSEKFWAGVKEK